METLTLDLERYLALIHSSPPEVLGRLLSDILDHPEDGLEHLKIYVPEVSLLLSRLLFAQDLEGAARMRVSLESALQGRDLDVESPAYIGALLEGPAGHLLTYYLGRLQGVLVLARRLPVLELPAHIRSEVQDEGENQAIVAVLSRQGAMSMRNLRQALRDELPESVLPSMEDLHRRLTRLVRIAVVEADSTVKRNLSYTISPLGRRLLEERPAWVEAVAASYKAYRQGITGLPCPYSTELDRMFQDIDRELNLPASAPKRE